jgi:hypothetical protein
MGLDLIKPLLLEVAAVFCALGCDGSIMPKDCLRTHPCISKPARLCALCVEMGFWESGEINAGQNGHNKREVPTASQKVDSCREVAHPAREASSRDLGDEHFVFQFT